MKYILIILALLLAGCEEKAIKVYVDANGTEIKQKEFETFKLNVVCDERGYAYNKQRTYMYSINTPIFKNNVYGAYQVTCKELK